MRTLALLPHPHRAPEGTEPGYVLADDALPHISVRDLGVTRGDGVFESIAVVAGAPVGAEAHLHRLAASAAALDLPAPHLPTWHAALATLAEQWHDHPRAALKAVYTRGIEGSGHPTGWVSASAAPDHSALRTSGVRAVRLDRGYRHDVADHAPWLLVGAKTLSYAINSAAIRHAHKCGADEVIFVSSDGYVLEAPTASVMLRIDGVWVSPGAGVLPGTTQRALFRFAERQGIPTRVRLVRAAELDAADAVWLVSSVRGAVPVTALDGAAVPVDWDLTAQLNAHLGVA